MRAILFAFTLALSQVALAADLGQQLEALGFFKKERVKRGGITSDQARLPFFGVSIDGGTLRVLENIRTANGVVSEMKGKHFTYAAIDNGEWGGGLDAVGPSGTKITLTRENVKGFFRLGAGIYALTGLAHLSVNTGRLYRIEESSDGARLALVTMLTGAPVDVIVEESDVFILTVNDLEVVHFNSGIDEFKLMVHDGPWDSVPSNMAKTGLY